MANRDAGSIGTGDRTVSRLERGSMDPRLTLYRLGYRDLVSVAPPGAEITPNSGLRADDLGKRPAKRGLNGWYGYNWITDEPSEADVRRWVEWDANVGLRGTRFPALDIDSEDEVLTQVVRKIALQFLGAAPARVGLPPKELLVYRTDTPFNRVALEIKRGTNTHLVEFLGHGRQYLVYGRHPSGRRYHWLRSPLWLLNPEELTVITPDQVEGFLAELETKLAPLGLELTRIGRASALDKDAPLQENLLAPSIEALASVVAAIPNDSVFDDRDDYVVLGHAIKAAAGADHEEEGYFVFSSWASRWENGTNDPAVVRSDWRRMHPPFRVGWSWLVEQAGERFQPAIWEFDADPTATPPPVTVPRDPTLPMPVDLTDDWLAEKILPDVIHKLRYDYPNGAWHVWDGTRWALDDRGKAEREVILSLRRLARTLRARIRNLSEEERKKYGKTIAKLGNVATVNAVTTMLSTHAGIAVGADTFDVLDMQLNTPGGIVDLTTGATLPHEPSAMHSKSTSVTPGAAEAPVWAKFLREVTCGDWELQRFLQKAAGYALTGSTIEQTLLFIWGRGTNGKSTFIETIAEVLGDYAAQAPFDTFTNTRGDKHPTDLAGLMGARLVTASETQKGRSWDEQRVKALTGGDRLRARFMRQDFVEFRPRFKIIMIGNHEPQIEVVDEAMRRRLHIVPFTFRPEVRDNELKDKLRAEYPAILRWCIDGCLLWQTEGLAPPERVVARTREYFADEDLPGQWLDECCRLEDGASVTRTDAYRSWLRFCHERGEEPGTLKSFRKLLQPYEAQHGFNNAKVGPADRRVAGWTGIALVEDDIQGSLT